MGEYVDYPMPRHHEQQQNMQPGQVPPVPAPVSKEAKKNAEETISKGLAAFEVSKELQKIKQLAIVSLFFMLFATGSATINEMFGMVLAVAYVAFAALRLFQANKKLKYLKYQYGF
jgi:hypothetical protein